MHSSLAFTWEISGTTTQFTVAVDGAPTPKAKGAGKYSTKHTFGGKHGAVREGSWEEHSDQFWIWMSSDYSFNWIIGVILVIMSYPWYKFKSKSSVPTMYSLLDCRGLKIYHVDCSQLPWLNVTVTPGMVFPAHSVWQNTNVTTIVKSHWPMIACLKGIFHLNRIKLNTIVLNNFRANKLSEKIDFCQPAFT